MGVHDGPLVDSYHPTWLLLGPVRPEAWGWKGSRPLSWLVVEKLSLRFCATHRFFMNVRSVE